MPPSAPVSEDVLVARSGPPAPRASGRAFRWPFELALVLIGLAAFAGAIGAGFTSWDDNLYVTENPHIRDLSLGGVVGLFTRFEVCNYHPLTLLSYQIEYALAGLDAALYHFDNVVLHALAGVLAFRLLRRWIGSEVPAFLGSLFFLIHPLRVESVVWVSERKDVLCAVFYLAALLAYPERPTRGRYLASLGLFLCALLSKAMAVSLPLALLIVAIRERRPLRREIELLVPFFALAALFTALGIAAQANDSGLYGLHGRRLSTHLLCIPMSIAHYAEKLVLPILLSPRYCPETPTGLGDPRVIAGLALAGLAAGAAARSFRARGPAFFGLSVFAVSWAPASGVVASSTIVADRYVYLPSVGLALALAGSIERSLRSRLAARVHPGRVAEGLLVAALAAYALLTPLRVEVWRDPLVLWEDALRENPRNSIAENQISVIHFESGRYVEAAVHAAESVRCGLRDPKFLYNVCVAYQGIGDAAKEFETAREIVRGLPGFLPAHRVILRHLRLARRFDEHARLLAELDRRFPGEAALVQERAEVAEALGDLEAALDLYREALRREPRLLSARLGACVVLARLGREETAAEIAAGVMRKAWRVPVPDVEVRERVRQLVEILERSGTPAARTALPILRPHCPAPAGGHGASGTGTV